MGGEGARLVSSCRSDGRIGRSRKHGRFFRFMYLRTPVYPKVKLETESRIRYRPPPYELQAHVSYVQLQGNQNIVSC